MSEFLFGIIVGALTFWVIISIALVLFDKHCLISLDNTLVGTILTAPVTIPIVILLICVKQLKSIYNRIRR